MTRTLYLIAYDITEDNRLHDVRYLLKGYSTGGQKSVYECFLTEGELKYVIGQLKGLIKDKDDRVHIFQMDGRSTPHVLGIALPPHDPDYFYIG
ncbi:MAG: CRISPR-associated endonuclease Cas2 [Candidatus Magnetobacterium sp. LHC-1]|uniref:CRISPR-associated endoribonuclease Cas2 n=1 Tax=Candidatus Magnetobacterium casense TaxID=1455061 RepID=A0ABS6S0S0_9BACT|nr:CRISPR-associated endonuclease Cas2 [Candidatus Magnetobacterium casensis]MBF0608517.1 CRISPR-associated endonuclease Cas2 [Nitrospirota bacterium]MBV6341993.1 CRISPR-associated endonuclease Cas2 [Candidatus Magnetobacterium casensis]